MPKYNNTIHISIWIFVVMMTFFPNIEAQISRRGQRSNEWSKIEGSTCSEACVADRFTVSDDDLAQKLLSLIDAGGESKEESISCLDTSKITNMEGLCRGYFEWNGKKQFDVFNSDLSCWNVAAVTTMKVCK